MKTNEETISSLFERREAFYKRRKKQRAITSASFLIVFSLTALVFCTMFTGEGYTSKPMMSEQETTIDDTYVGANDGLSIADIDEAKDSSNNSTRIVINELDAVPTRFKSRYISTIFDSMSAEDMLSFFRIRLDMESLFEDYGLQEEDHEHGFYVKPDGTSHEQDYFLYFNEDNSKQLTITLQSANIADVYMLSDFFDQPVCSYVSGKKVYIFHWQDNEYEELYCEFTYKDNVEISICMKNLGTSELVDLIEYIVMQEPIFIEAEIVP